MHRAVASSSGSPTDLRRRGRELVLTVPGGISELRFLPGKNGNAVDSTGSGVVREREALRTLAHNGWIDATVEGTTLKIRLGKHAKKVRAGMENGAHP
jgi:hypothetical protein